MEIKVLLFIFSCYFFCGEAESLMCYKCSSTNHTCNDGACNSTTGYCETVTEYLSDAVVIIKGCVPYVPQKTEKLCNTEEGAIKISRCLCFSGDYCNWNTASSLTLSNLTRLLTLFIPIVLYSPF